MTMNDKCELLLVLGEECALQFYNKETKHVVAKVVLDEKSIEDILGKVKLAEAFVNGEWARMSGGS